MSIFGIFAPQRWQCAALRNHAFYRTTTNYRFSHGGGSLLLSASLKQTHTLSRERACQVSLHFEKQFYEPVVP